MLPDCPDGGCSSYQSAGECFLTALRDGEAATVTTRRCDTAQPDLCTDDIFIATADGTMYTQPFITSQMKYYQANACPIVGSDYFATCLDMHDEFCATSNTWVEACMALESDRVPSVR